MSTKTLERELISLRREVASLRSLVFGIAAIKDSEGEYHPEFVKRIKKAAKEKPVLQYKGPGSLLKRIKALK